ncbi:MAG: phage major capsid protein [Desulfurellales bacterium]|nr:MAG: phage major capsid protein [Desulfurellales bacterium]
MNLTQFLALWRTADTPEKRKELLAGLTAQQRQALNPLVIERVTALHSNQNRTDDENAEYRDLTLAGTELSDLVRADSEQATRAAALIQQNQQRTPNPALSVSQTENRTDTPHNPQAQAQVPSWRQAGGAAAFQGNPQIARAIAGDLYAYGVQDRQIEHLASREYADEFFRWMRSCASNPMGSYQSRALNEVTIDGGAAVVPLDVIAEIIQRRAATKRVSSLVRRFQTSRDTLSVPKFLGGDSVKINDLAVQWLGAEGSATEDTSLEAFGNVEIKVHRGGIKIVADRAWLEDAAFDMESWVIEQITDMYESMLEYIIISGSGVGRPFGLTTRTGTTTAAAGLYTCDNIGDPIDFVGLMSQQGSLDAQYASGAAYLFRRSALYSQVLSILSTTGQPVMGTASTMTGGTVGRVDTQVLGVPTYQSDYMAAAAAGAKVNYYGDFRQAYGLVERVTLQIEPLIDPALQVKDQRGWYVRFRLGGDRLAEWALRCGLNTDHS